MDPALLKERLATASRTFATLERQLADPAVAADPSRLQSIARERSRLEPLVRDQELLENLERERASTALLLREQRSDPAGAELAELAAEELQLLEARIEALRRSQIGRAHV